MPMISCELPSRIFFQDFCTCCFLADYAQHGDAQVSGKRKAADCSEVSVSAKISVGAINNNMPSR